jgi:hypothetical protein
VSSEPRGRIGGKRKMRPGNERHDRLGVWEMADELVGGGKCQFAICTIDKSGSCACSMKALRSAHNRNRQLFGNEYSFSTSSATTL